MVRWETNGAGLAAICLRVLRARALKILELSYKKPKKILLISHRESASPVPVPRSSRTPLTPLLISTFNSRAELEKSQNPTQILSVAVFAAIALE